MKQVFVRKGEIAVEDVPAPVISEDEILVEVYYSCISAGTEIAGVKASGKPLIKKVIEKPQNVKKVIEYFRKEGFSSTINNIVNKIESRSSIGYSCAGVAIDTGSKIKNIKKGDKVACAGAGIANHAEFVAVPENLAVKLPNSLILKEAATVTLGSIALQGIRRCNPVIGESVVVIGLGLIGQLTIQFLKLSGCYVIGTDLDRHRIDIAIKNGLDRGIIADDPNIIGEIIRETNGFGSDYVIITAASKDSNVINQAIKMCRKKGKVVIVGDVNLTIEREEFYKKELDLLMSTSYGPGRYDEKYENKGFDYPYAYVRWTENRNMAEYINLLSRGKINTDKLIDDILPVEEASRAYEMLKNNDRRPLVILLEYKKEKVPEKKIILKDYKPGHEKINVGIIGAGSFVKGMHLPNLRKMDNIFKINAICSKTGSNSDALAMQYGAKYSATDYRLLLEDRDIDMVIIGTRHNLHADIAREALIAGKAVFLEKPMALNENELNDLIKAIENKQMPFTVGFNRRFSPFLEKIKSFTDKRTNPMIISYRVNAGFLPKEHWVNTEEGGGRNIGEACHFYDLFNFLTGSEVNHINATGINPQTGQYGYNDNFVAVIKYRDGSVCNLVYTSLGIESAPKELMEIYFDNKIISLNDYKELAFFGINAKNMKSGVQNKGQFEMLLKFGTSLKSNTSEQIIPIWQLIQATRISFEVEKQLKNGNHVSQV